MPRKSQIRSSHLSLGSDQRLDTFHLMDDDALKLKIIRDYLTHLRKQSPHMVINPNDDEIELLIKSEDFEKWFSEWKLPPGSNRIEPLISGATGITKRKRRKPRKKKSLKKRKGTSKKKRVRRKRKSRRKVTGGRKVPLELEGIELLPLAPSTEPPPPLPEPDEPPSPLAPSLHQRRR